MAPGTKTRVLGFSSGKGGVGKSSVTVSVAAALAARGHKVGILDADVYGFSVPKMLGLQRPPAVIGKLLVPPVAFGIKTMSIGYFVSDDTPVIWRGPMLHKALEQFVVDVFWGDLDFLCVDLPPGTGDVTLSLAEYLPKVETFVVTTPQAAAERVAQRSALAARKLKLPLRGVIENMSYFRGDDGKRYDIFGQGGGEKLAASLEVPLIGSVPIDIPLREGGDDGTPVVVSNPDSEVAKAFFSLAESIEGMGPARIYKTELKVR
ncbi:MAG: Mrp/NBP35 family ATP-binding protein [Nitrospiraceae bacterium]|nr:Mrp/NBP35 family ATP-binding protein [Nitrospiraceae bacterium]